MAVKIWMFACITCLGIGLYIGKTYYGQVQTVEVEKEVVRKDIVTVVKEVIKPDGSKTTETITTDKSSEKKDTLTKVSATRLPDWAISIQAISASDLKPYYGVQVDRRILGPFSIVIGINQHKEASLGLKMEF